jgi:oligopeptide transport system permease protein
VTDPIPRGESPGRLAWRRFAANRVALVSLVLVAAIAAITAVATWIAPQDAERQHTWIGAQPPGFTHPDAVALNRFTVGERAEAAPRAMAAASLEYSVREQARTDYRLTLRRDLLRSITRVEGAVDLPELDLSTVQGVALDADGREAGALPAVRLVAGEAPPAGFFPAGEKVLLLRVAEDRPPVVYAIALDHGVVRGVIRDGVAATEATIRGEQVHRVLADGRELVIRHRLGTDQLGRDLLSRTLVGGQVSLLVGLVATVVSLAIGVLYGATSGYLGGRADRWLMGGVDVLYAVPFMFLVILLLTFFQRSLLMLFIALGAVQWLTMARIVRGQVQSLVNAEFIAAARLSGASHWRIISRHLIPNCLGPVIVYTTLTVPAVILQESFLAFLGLGVGFAGRQVDSWGALVSAGAAATNQPWLLIVPAVLMSVTLLALNLLGDGLRDALDPRMEVR